MIERLESIISAMFQPNDGEDNFSIFDPAVQLDEDRTDPAGIAQSLNAAFLILLAGRGDGGGGGGAGRPAFERAHRYLSRMTNSSEWAEVAGFFLKGRDLIHEEIETVCKDDAGFAERLAGLSEWLSDQQNLKKREETIKKIWSVFFPEALHIRTRTGKAVEDLRAKRTITLTALNDKPITHVARQILFTSNIILAAPPASRSLDELSLSEGLKERLSRIAREPQLHWYDHPIQIGVEPEKNEVLYGLRGLDAALAFEQARGEASRDEKLTCVLSVSVTHQGLKDIVRTYLGEEFACFGGLNNLEVTVFTEEDTRRMIDDVLDPAAGRYLHRDDAKELLSVFGVDGEYGRHYSFLKAIAAFWNVFIQPEIRATFKIDLDQVFPQKALVEQTGRSAFAHLATPLWGARGVDADGKPVELGMIAGALVNESDIDKSLFTPDVLFPDPSLSPDEYIFFSPLPQAVSTEAEMMTRYNTEKLDGRRTCIQRIHVTGGTNGILVDPLRRYRPFTPSFIGRGEDQAYLLSVLSHREPRLAYLHKDGLIMRHDKETFAQEAIQAASVGKLIGDYVRILYFSAYAETLGEGSSTPLKDAVDPFTGCFISGIPKTVVFLRFGLKAASLFTEREDDQGLEFVTLGSRNIAKALDFVRGENNGLRQAYERERRGWDVYYDVLSAVEDALRDEDAFALDLRKGAQQIVDQCAVRFGRA